MDALLEPISTEQPAGTDPRADVSPTSVYFSLKDVRATARAAERAAQVDDEPLMQHAALWRPIAEQVPAALSELGKDLELAAWFIEAQCRLLGFAGLAQGFNLAQGLIERFWDDIYPLPDEDGIETRIAPLIGLNGYGQEGSLVMPIASIPLVEGSDGSYACWQYEQACELERLDPDKQAQRIAQGAASMEMLQQACAEMSSAELIAQLTQIDAAIAAFSALTTAIDSACGEPQPTSQISQRLRKCREAFYFLAGERIERAQASEQLVVEAGSEAAPDSDTMRQPAGLDSRSAAIATLKQVAEYFRRAEPHSPMSYAIDQVIRWSDMPLPALLQELIADGDARNGFCRLAGIPINEN